MEFYMIFSCPRCGLLYCVWPNNGKKNSAFVIVKYEICVIKKSQLKLLLICMLINWIVESLTNALINCLIHYFIFLFLSHKIGNGDN